MLRRIILPLVALAVAATLVAPTGASAQTTFTFYGSGYGHGIGMSQWGAFGLAKAGWTAPDILAHYYTDTAIEPFDLGEPLRVGLGTGRASVRIQATTADVPLAVGGETVATIPAGQTWTVVPVGTAGFEIRDAGGTAVAGPVGATTDPITAMLDGSPVKLENGRTYARGNLELGLHLCGKICSIRLIVVVGMEEYLYGLGEVPSSWPSAALETQAIAARTYAANKALVSQRRSPCDCAVLSTTYDQVYIGADKETGTGGARWVAAVDATAGQVVTYDGEPIQAYYMSSSGGHTEDNDAVWGGTPIPYLRGVCDPGDYVSANPSATWTVTRSAEEVTAALKIASVGTVTGFTVDERGASGRILRVTVQGDAGSATISGNTLQSRLGLRDDRLWIGVNLLVTGAVRTKYDALMCGPGEALTPQTTVQTGLRQRFAAATIFQGPDLGAFSLDGAVLAFYLSKKGPRGELGFPTSDVRTLSNSATRARFQNGVVTCPPDGATCRLKLSTG